MSATFKSGATVFSETGERAEYVAKTGDGHIVRPVVEAFNGDEDYDHVCEPVLWRSVFAKPPVAKYSDELKALHEQIAAARAERLKIDSEYSQRQRERAAKLKRFSVLDNLEDFIDGKITHYVTKENYGPPEIVPVQTAISSGDRYRQDLKLLTLGGSLKDGIITWKLGQYSDGSGSSSGVIPCTSLEQAEALVHAKVVEHFAANSTNYGPRQNWIDAAARLGVSVPEAYRLAVAKIRIENIQSNIAYTRRQAADYAANVEKADAELAELSAYVASSGVAK